MMKKIFRLGISLTFGIFMALASMAQVSVTTSNSAGLLAQMLAGKGVTILNPKLSGAMNVAGFFTATNSNLGIKEGIVLTTGVAAGLADYGNTFMSEPVCSFCMDNDLLTLSQQNGSNVNTMNDAVILEFDILPIGDTLKFNYIFGSEEYPAFVCSNYNDVFGFFISGPGISGTFSGGSRNIALVPGTNVPVGINTINEGGTNCPSNSQFYINNSGTTNSVVLNGFTTVLEAKIAVIPCQTYHIKLKIADAGDQAYDSAVFLEAGSFSSAEVKVTAGNNTPTHQEPYDALEGCKNSFFTFTRKVADSKPLVVKYLIAGTATNGVDYNLIPDSIVILANQHTAVLPIIAVADMLKESKETIKIYLLTQCTNVYLDSATLYIEDEIISNISPEKSICIGASAQLEVSKGLTYQWQPVHSLNDPSIYNPVATPEETTVYTVTISYDNCQKTDSVRVVVNQLPDVTAAPDTAVCAFEKVQLTASSAKATEYKWAPATGLSDPNIPNPSATISGTTVYTVTASDALDCKNTDTVTLTVYPLPAVDAGADVLLFTEETVALQGTGAGDYFWAPADLLSDPNIPNPSATPAKTTTFTLTVINDQGCRATDDMIIYILRETERYFSTAFSPNGDGINDLLTFNNTPYEIKEINIFNRWGDNIFSSTSASSGWDGTVGGTECPIGVYIYSVKYAMPATGELRIKNGNVTLLR